MSLISIDLKSDFGFFKKPDINDSIYLTYNMIHKPALFGFLGAVLGLKGHWAYQKLPEYYNKLHGKIQVGIEPIGLGQKNGNFEKAIVKYINSTGFANEDEDHRGSTLIIPEQILIKPAYRIYLELDENEGLLKELIDRLRKGEAVYIPYLGKNDFFCWWDDFEDHGTISGVSSNIFKIITIFRKPTGTTLKQLRNQIAFGFMAGMKEEAEPVFSQFERLPVCYNEELSQYSEAEEFVYTNMKFSKEKFYTDENFRQLENGDVIYLF